MKVFHKAAKITLVLVYMVILAGAVVRMTGSGMGCPDWPKCFGYYIPPTDVEQVKWHPQQSFHKGQIIIINESLKVAKSDFTSTENYNPENWDKYTKHDYAVFNAAHTWTEYVNRLFGALSGFATLILAFLSLKYIKRNPRVTILSFLIVFLMGFQAWLGATVVFSVLNPIRITLHMLVALIIVAMLLHLIAISRSKERMFVGQLSFKIKIITIIVLLMSLVQILLGTQVRQWVDTLSEVNIKDIEILKAPISFYIHRSFSILILIANGYLWWLLRKEHIFMKKINWVMILLLIIVGTGIAMNYFQFPFGSQSIHLVLASIVFGIQYYIMLLVQKQNRIS